MQIVKKLNSAGDAMVTAIIVLVLAAIVGFTGWYVWQARQGSDQTYDETRLQESDQTSDTQQDQPAVRTGTFASVNNKSGSGGVTVTQNPDGSSTVTLGENFVVQNGPALYVAFSDSGIVDTNAYIAPLQSFSGAQTYTVPANIDPAKYNQVMIWCHEFSVAFAVADLTQN